MARNRRSLDPVSLSFLDVMSCGFGALILLFLILKHQGTERTAPHAPIDSEVRLLEHEVNEGRKNLAELRATAEELERRNETAEALARQLQQELDDPTSAAEGSDQAIETMRRQLAALEQRKRQIDEELKAKGADVREFSGSGRRAYLTGLRLDGQRTLILLDVSSSMLAENLVNVIRFRNMKDAARKLAPKWRQAVGTVEWLTARFQPDLHYQVSLFNTAARAALPGTDGTWLNTSNADELERVIESISGATPEGGSSLAAAFSQIARFNPLPDNVILVTDGLPTQGDSPGSKTTISGQDRERLFRDAIQKIPQKVPVNIILLPMEGDPAAAGSFWRLAQMTSGSLLTPTRDWP